MTSKVFSAGSTFKWENEDREIYTINEPAHAYQLVKEELESSDRERFLSILLTTRNTVIGVETLSIGTLSNCLIWPRELLKSALLANAHGAILVHNHPSGDLTPSEEDIRIHQDDRPGRRHYGHRESLIT